MQQSKKDDRRKEKTMEKFYFMKRDYDANYAKSIYVSHNTDIMECELCGGIYVQILGELHIKMKGKKKGDYYCVPGHFILGKKLRDLFIENKITGFELKDICIDSGIGFEKEGLQEMVIVGRSGYLQKADGTLFGKCEKCGRVLEDMDGYVGTMIHDWDGSDVFLIKNLRGIPVVTEKVKELCEKNKIKNVVFTDVTEFEFI